MQLLLSFPSRGAVYALLIILGFVQFYISVNLPSSDPEKEPYLSLFSVSWLFIACLTFVWMLILCGFGCSRLEKYRFLARCDIHLWSFGVISSLWLCLGIFLTVNAKNECDHHTMICSRLRSCAIIAFIIFLSALYAAASVKYSISVSGLDAACPVEYVREKAIEQLGRSSRTNDNQDYPQVVSLAVLPLSRPLAVYTARRDISDLPV